MAQDELKNKIELVIIAGSAGSFGIILRMLDSLKNSINFSIIVLIHRKDDYDSMLGDIFQSKTALRVINIEEKEYIRPGCIYVAPADYHLLIEKDKTFTLDYSEKINYSRPSFDVTFQSASAIYKKNLACILLSGANSDGAVGLTHVINNGGMAIVQNPATAEVPYMPQQAISFNKNALVLSPEIISDTINSF